MKLIQVEGHKGLRREERTRAIVNTDREALLAARRRKEQVLKEKERVNNLEAKIERLEKLIESLLEEKV